MIARRRRAVWCATKTGDWFEPPVPVAATGYLSRSVRPAWRGSVWIVGADFGAELTHRFERDGAVEGYATLAAIWTADRLRVERQDLYVPRHPKIPDWTVPPCPPPERGWPHHTWIYGIKDVQTGERPTAPHDSPSLCRRPGPPRRLMSCPGRR